METAEKTLKGFANPAAVKWCAPYSLANSSGWWLSPPQDIDIHWDGELFTHEEITKYGGEDRDLVLGMASDSDHPDMWCPPGGRSKYTWAVVEPNVVQVWTGLIFQTPPGWCLHVKEPANTPRRPFSVMEGVLETDWMCYDIWVNLAFHEPGTVNLRRDQILAQLIPVRREDWAVRESPPTREIFRAWADYNEKKFAHGGRQALSRDGSRTKDSTTFYREKNKHFSRVVCYCISPTGPYPEMLRTSIATLRRHNPHLRVKVISVGGPVEADAEVIVLPRVADYFSAHKFYLAELEEDSVLYLDADTFVNGDLGALFDNYGRFAACVDDWVYSRGWDDSWLPVKPWNSGVQLFQNGYHRQFFRQLRAEIDKILSGTDGLSRWVMGHAGGCLREEFACSVIAARDGCDEYFSGRDVLHSRYAGDVVRSRDPAVFHTFTSRWRRSHDYRTRKIVWRGLKNIEPPARPGTITGL